MMRSPAPHPPQMPLPPRGNRQVIIWGAVVVAVVAFGWLMWTMGRKGPVISRELRDRPPGEQVAIAPSTPASELRYPEGYTQAPPPPTAPPASTVLPPQGAPPPRGTPPAGTVTYPPPPTMPPPLQPPSIPAPSPQRGVQVQQSVAVHGQRQPADQPKRWFSTPTPPQGDILQPPLPHDPKEEEQQQSKLFPKAVWEKPANRYKVLYADQIVSVQLSQDVNSDFPGVYRLKVTDDVEDRWGQGHVIVPRDTTFMVKMAGQANFGQERIPSQVYMGIFPDGTAVSWNNGQVGDAMGAAGLPADVNNHYAKLFLGVGLQALLNVGTRLPFGSPSGFQQNLPQEFAQDASQGVSQAGQRIITQQFQVRPTLTQETGYPATIQFLENVSFQTNPVTIRK